VERQGFISNFCTFLEFRELKEIKKHVSRNFWSHNLLEPQELLQAFNGPQTPGAPRASPGL
jgi:hypothetical protein